MSRDQEHELTVVSNMLPQIEEHLHKITEHHKTVSNLKTPSSQVKKRGFDGQEYVELSYMRLIADENDLKLISIGLVCEELGIEEKTF